MKHYNLTLSGVAQQLSEAVPATDAQPRTSCRTILLQPQGDNANPVYVGGVNATVSSSDYGFRLEAGSGGVPPAPFVLGEHDDGPLRLENLWVIGTASEVLHIAIVPR